MHPKNETGNATAALVHEEIVSIISNKTRHHKIGARVAQLKPHGTRKREDTKSTLEVLFLCPIQRVVFIVDIYTTTQK